MSSLLENLPPGFNDLVEGYDNSVFSPTLAGWFPDHIHPFGKSYNMELAAVSGLHALVLKVRAIRETASSWRDYRVGAAITAYSSDTGQIATFVGANSKPFKDGTINVHAEQVALAKARKHGYPKVSGVLVMADPGDPNANPNNTPTLRPCVRCIDMIDQTQEIPNSAVVMTTGLDKSVCELFTIGELIRARKTGQLEGLAELSVFPMTEEKNYTDFDRIFPRRLMGQIVDEYYRGEYSNRAI